MLGGDVAFRVHLNGQHPIPFGLLIELGMQCHQARAVAGADQRGVKIGMLGQPFSDNCGLARRGLRQRAQTVRGRYEAHLPINVSPGQRAPQGNRLDFAPQIGQIDQIRDG